jgi:hypothetical protein
MVGKPKVKIKNEITEKLDLMIVTKCPLKNICKDNSLLNGINKQVLTVNKIVIQVYQFLNLYLIRKYDKGEDFPEINDIFIKAIIKTITKRQDTRGKPPSETTKQLLSELKQFYDTEYKKCIIGDDIQEDTKLNFIIAYEVIDIITNIENNIKEHFVDYVNKFVNNSFNSKSKIQEINNNKNLTKDEKKELKNKFYSELRKIKKDLLKINNEYESDKQYNKWIDEHRKNIVRKNKFVRDSIDYDLCSNTQDYLKSLFYMNKELEKINDQNIKDNKNEIKLFQIIPQRTNIIQKYITIDTASLINLTIKENSIKYLSNIEKYQKELWSNKFKTTKKEFKRKNYSFNYMIKTDGIGCSVLLIKLKDGKPIYITSNMQKCVKKKKELLDQYIEDVEITDEMKGKRIVTIDPNLSDLIYCVSKTTPYEEIIKDNNGKIIKHVKQDENLTFRYTQNQRRLETRNKKYNKIIQNLNKTTQINGKIIKEIETELSKYNSKTVDYNKFINYCKKKNDVNRILFEHYTKTLFRKLKLNIYINTQKSESKMINNFKNKYGKPEDVIVVLGDYDKGNHNMKGKEPIINRRIRTIFRNNKYNIYKINEFRTSKLCNKCCGECKTFLERASHKPKTKGEKVEVWGIVHCKNGNCNMIHNRDKNSALNMYKITKSIFEGKERPKEYCRETKIHSH